MTAPKLVSRWVLVAGLLAALIGAIHAVSLLYAGLSMAYASHGLRRSERWARVISLGAGVFILLVSVSALRVSPGAHPLFWVMTVGAASSIVLVLIERDDHPLPPRHGRFFSGLVD